VSDTILDIQTTLTARLDEYEQHGATVFEWLELAGELRDFGMYQPAQVCERRAKEVE